MELLKKMVKGLQEFISGQVSKNRNSSIYTKIVKTSDGFSASSSGNLLSGAHIVWSSEESKRYNPDVIYDPTFRLAGTADDLKAYLKSFKKGQNSELSSEVIKKIIDNAYTKSNFESDQTQNIYSPSYPQGGDFELGSSKAKSFVTNFQNELNLIKSINSNKTKKATTNKLPLNLLEDFIKSQDGVKDEKPAATKQTKSESEPKAKSGRNKAYFEKSLGEIKAKSGFFYDVAGCEPNGVGCRSKKIPDNTENFYTLEAKGLLHHAGFSSGSKTAREGVTNFLKIYKGFDDAEADRFFDELMGPVTSAPKMVEKSKKNNPKAPGSPTK